MTSEFGIRGWAKLLMMQLLKVLGDYEALEKAVISAVGAALEETDRRGAADARES